MSHLSPNELESGRIGPILAKGDVVGTKCSQNDPDQNPSGSGNGTCANMGHGAGCLQLAIALGGVYGAAMVAVRGAKYSDSTWGIMSTLCESIAVQATIGFL